MGCMCNCLQFWKIQEKDLSVVSTDLPLMLPTMLLQQWKELSCSAYRRQLSLWGPIDVGTIFSRLYAIIAVTNWCVPACEWPVHIHGCHQILLHFRFVLCNSVSNNFIETNHFSLIHWDPLISKSQTCCSLLNDSSRFDDWGRFQ